MKRSITHERILMGFPFDWNPNLYRNIAIDLSLNLQSTIYILGFRFVIKK